MTTTSSPATTTVAPPVACFNAATATGLCRLRLDASCSTGAIDVYSWTLDTGGALNGPVTVSGNPVEHTYGTVCLLTTVTNVLTVSGPGGNDSDSRQFMFLLHRTDGTSSSSRFETRLDGFEGAPVTGSLIVNDAIVRAAATASPETIVFPARGGENVVEALISSQARGVGYWSFDFTGDDAFVAGSLRVELGAVAAANARRIVFRLGDDQPRTIRFRFELRAAGKP